MSESDDYTIANRLCELPAIHRQVDADFTVRDIARDANWQEWNDCLELFGHAACDTRGVTIYLGKGV